MPTDEELAREILNVPGFIHHWIPEHYEAALLHAKSVIARVRLDEAKQWMQNTIIEQGQVWADKRIAALEQAVGGEK